MKKKTKQDNKDLNSILRSSKQLSRLDESSIDAISTAIHNSGIMIPRSVENNKSSELQENAIKLSKLDIVILALTSNPNKWFLVFTGDRRRQDIGLYQLGGCFEIVRRKENGKINHYARYNGKPMNESGNRRMDALRKKIESLGNAAKKNGVVEIHDATPAPKGNSIKSISTAPHAKRTRKISKKKKNTKTSLQHAAMYPLTLEEQKFLEFIKLTPRNEYLVSSGTKTGDSWFSFRWKWQSRYGFDMSQISVRQELQADGTYNTYLTYMPNAVNMMNPGLKSLIDFLESKGKKKSNILQISENQIS